MGFLGWCPRHHHPRCPRWVGLGLGRDANSQLCRPELLVQGTGLHTGRSGELGRTRDPRPFPDVLGSS